MKIILQDIRYSLRALFKKPGFTLVIVLTLALGIGANTSIFSIVNGVLLRPLPFQSPDRLVRITFNLPGLRLADIPFSVPELEDLRTRAGIFEEVTVVWPVSVNLTGGKQPERLELLGVSPNYFSMLGATPQIGRLFGMQDVAPGFAEAAVISDGLWRRSYGADPNILGKRLKLDNDPYTIVGVLPPGFRHPGRTVARDVEVWATAGFSADPFPKPVRTARGLPGAMGRLKPGITPAQAQARLAAMSQEIRSDFPGEYPPEGKWSIEAQPLQDSLVGSVRPQLLILMAAVILIILIASVNIANLLLARASGRQQEMAVRLALGASRGRMIGQMLTESLVLSLLGGLAGILTAGVALRALLPFVPASIPRLSEVQLDGTVLAFALFISLLTGILFGLVPAVQASRADIVGAMREGARGSGSSAKTYRARSLLIVSELALAVVLMVGAGLLLRTFWGLLQTDPGFRASGVVTASVWLPVPNDPKTDVYANLANRASFVREVLRRAAAVPGAQIAAMTSDLPGSRPATTAPLAIEDLPRETSQDLTAEVIRVSPGYFELLQTSLVRGRFFAENDEAGKQEVALIDETTASRYWPGLDPLDRRIRLGRNPAAPWLTIVGIVKDIKQDGLDSDGVPHVFRPLYQQAGRSLSVVVRMSALRQLPERQIREAIQAVDPELPVFNVRSLEDIMEISLASRRFSAALVGAFGAVALLLSSIGVYGLLAYMVGQRYREIGIRMALGAHSRDIFRLMLSRGFLLASTGIGIGMILAAATAPMISVLLYGVRPLDGPVFVAVPLLFLGVAFLAIYIPARRATKVDPISALREG